MQAKLPVYPVPKRMSDRKKAWLIVIPLVTVGLFLSARDMAQKRGFASSPMVKVTWSRNYGAGTYGYVESIGNEPLQSVTLSIAYSRPVGQNGFYLGNQTNTTYAKWSFRPEEPEYGTDSLACNIPADRKRRFDFPFSVPALPAQITVTVNGQEVAAVQDIEN